MVSIELRYWIRKPISFHFVPIWLLYDIHGWEFRMHFLMIARFSFFTCRFLFTYRHFSCNSGVFLELQLLCCMSSRKIYLCIYTYHCVHTYMRRWIPRHLFSVNYDHLSSIARRRKVHIVYFVYVSGFHNSQTMWSVGLQGKKLLTINYFVGPFGTEISVRCCHQYVWALNAHRSLLNLE